MLSLSIKDFSILREGKTIINSLNAEINGATFVAIVGNNGVGKSSLLKSLYGSLPFTGEAFFYTEHGGAIAKKKLAYLGQKNFLGFDIKVADFLVMAKYAANTHRTYSSSDYKAGLEILQLMGCESLYEKQVLALSGGEQQLIWLVQTLNKSADVILLDEPCQGLDVKNRMKVYRLLSEIAHTQNKMILCVSHDIHDLQKTEGKLLNLSALQRGIQTISSQVLTQAYEDLLL